MGVSVSTQAGEKEKGISRRRLLKSALVFSAIGGGLIILGGSAKFPTAAAPPTSKDVPQPPANVDSSPGVAQSSVQAVHTSSSSASNAILDAPVKVKAMYFQMPLVVSVREEHFILPSPPFFRDFLSKVLESHPALSPMIPSMLILMDGVPAQASAMLRDGDEVDFIPAIAGG